MLIRGDARQLPLRDGCVDCVVTSPPYWGLRDYGNEAQIGLEREPQIYTDSLVDVMREARRVLKDAGTVWLNIGDSYAGGGKAGSNKALSGKQGTNRGSLAMVGRSFLPSDLASKQLVGIPWRVAFALQADGWYLRSDIIWAKPNPMPESVTDRPTKAHEYLFLLAKSERYYYDAAAIAEPVSAAMLQQMDDGYEGLGLKDYDAAGVQNPSSVKMRIIANARKRQPWRDGSNADSSLSLSGKSNVGDGVTRNRRTVWNVNTSPYSGAHFATMPEKLVEPCILAGCPMGGLVLDPFVGSGTVVAVAQRLGRRGVGVDLSYQDLAKKRTAQRGLRFGEEHTA
jgi:DNA modification methylase